MSKATLINEAPPKETFIEVGDSKHLRCDYSDTIEDKCSFHVYRIDGKKIEGKQELIFKASGIIHFRSDRALEPKFSWFNEKEEEIRLAFDITFPGKRFPCKDQILIIKKGQTKVNLFWGDVKRLNYDQVVNFYAECSTNGETGTIEEFTLQFPLFIIDPKKPKHLTLETGARDLSLNRSVSSPNKANYNAFNSSFKKSDNNHITISSDINLKNFFNHFCEFTLKGTIEELGTQYSHILSYKERIMIAAKGKGSNKTFSRHFLYTGIEVLDFYEKEGIIPPMSFQKNEFVESIFKAKDFKEKVEDLYKQGSLILKGQWGKLFGGYVNDLLIKKVAVPLAIDLLEKYNKSLYSNRYFKEESGLALENYEESKSIRRKEFRIWFQKHNDGLWPGSLEYQNKVKVVLSEYLKIKNTSSGFLTDQVLDDFYRYKVSPLKKIDENWKKYYEEFLKEESAILKFLKKVFDNSFYRKGR